MNWNAELRIKNAELRMLSYKLQIMKTFKLNTGILSILFFILPHLLLSQDNKKHEHTQPKKDKIEELKIAYITKELNLSISEAEKFWPIYNEMNKNIREVRKGKKKIEKEIREAAEKITEEELKTKLNAILDSEIKEAQLKKEYTEKIAAVIGYKKAVKLLKIEQEFKRELLNRLKETQQSHPANTPQK